MSLRANLTLLLVCAVLPAQVAEKPLNNTDVGNMIKAGLPEGSVILAIERAVERGNTKFDVSPAAMIDLGRAGATEAVLNSILLAPNIPPYEPSTSVQGLPIAAGLYYQAGTNWNSLDSVVVWPQIDYRFKTNWKTLGASDNALEIRHYVVPGRQAGVRVTGARPSFFLRGQRPDRGWWVLRLQAGADRREAITKIPDALSHRRTMSFQYGDPVNLEPTVTAADVVTLRPTADLTPGEYMVFKWVPGQQWLIQGFTFQVG
jgi:hypothetical protein